MPFEIMLMLTAVSVLCIIQIVINVFIVIETSTVRERLAELEIKVQELKGYGE